MTPGVWFFLMVVVPVLPTYILTHPWISYVFWPITNPTWSLPQVRGAGPVRVRKYSRVESIS